MVIGQRDSLNDLKDPDAGIDVIVAAARLHMTVNVVWLSGLQRFMFFNVLGGLLPRVPCWFPAALWARDLDTPKSNE